MTDLRKLARGQDCQVRIPGVCNHDPATTVLAHFRLAGFCGTGMKPSNLLAAWSCSSCHDATDGRMQTEFSRDTLRLYHAEGVMRTLAIIERDGKL